MKLDRGNVENVQTSPYRIFRVDNVFERAVLDDLTVSFPCASDSAWSTIAKGNKQYLNNDKDQFFEFLGKHKAWREVYDFFARPDTVEFLYSATGGGNEQRAAYQRKSWQISHNIHMPLKHSRVRKLGMMVRNRVASHVNVRYGFEFSSLGEGATIPPHTDAENKLLSLMLYFPPNEAPAAPVGTEFYAPKPGLPWADGWSSGLLGKDESDKFFSTHDAFYQTSFVGNVLYGFVKSDRSWHGLKTPIAKESAPRRSVNINYFLDG